MIARAIGFALILSSVAQPAEAAQPITDWKIELSELRCIAVRQYGDPAKPITLALKASPVASTFQLAILRYGYRKGQVQSNATLTFDGESFKVSALSYPTSGNKRVTHLLNLDIGQAAAARTAKSMKVNIPEGLDGDFRLGPLPQAIVTGLNECVERLQVTWNVGEERQSRLSKAATRDPASSGFVSPDDYPAMAQRLDQQGASSFLILIDEKGIPRDCTLIETSGSALLDSRTCGVLMERARFSPARDASGNPVKSSHTQTIRWSLEG